MRHQWAEAVAKGCGGLLIRRSQRVCALWRSGLGTSEVHANMMVMPLDHSANEFYDLAWWSDLAYDDSRRGREPSVGRG